MTLKTKRLLHWVGSTLAVVSLLFVAQRLRLYAGQMELAERPVSLWVTMGVLSVVYCGANLCLPRLWSACLLQQGLCLASRRVMTIYGYSQIGKYLPGNIVHLAGRQALAMAENLPGKALAASIMWEMLLLAIVAMGAFLPPALVLFLRPGWSPIMAICLFVFGCVAIFWCGQRLLGNSMCVGMYWAFVFLCCMAVIWAVSLVAIATGDIPAHWLGASAVWYVTAWLIGFVTPGAPAGLGMREAALLVLAKSAPISETDLLLATLCCRGISVLGDVGFFLIALRERVRKTRNCSHQRQEST